MLARIHRKCFLITLIFLLLKKSFFTPVNLIKPFYHILFISQGGQALKDSQLQVLAQYVINVFHDFDLKEKTVLIPPLIAQSLNGFGIHVEKRLMDSFNLQFCDEFQTWTINLECGEEPSQLNYIFLIVLSILLFVLSLNVRGEKMLVVEC